MALDHNSTEKQKAAVNEAYRLRGVILGSFAHIEYTLADLCIEAWRLPAYRSQARRFPYKVETRIAAARRLFDVEGAPLRKFRDRANDLLGALLSYEEERHFMAHGLMTVLFGRAGGFAVEFKLYRPTRTGADVGVFVWTLDQMISKADEASAYTNQWLRFLYEVHADLGWIGEPK